jgi:ribonuclease HI
VKRAGPSLDRVQEIVTAIARLEPAERRRLFDLLVEQGQLPAGSAGGEKTSARPGQRPKGVGSATSPHYVLIFDGGSKGNPGPGYGSYVIRRVQDGAERLERLELGDNYTSKEAEYDTLLAALQDLMNTIQAGGREPGEFSLEVRGDSALVINQLEGRWKAKEPRMKQRRDACLQLLRRFGSVRLKAQPREESVRVLGH